MQKVFSYILASEIPICLSHSRANISEYNQKCYELKCHAIGDLKYRYICFFKKGFFFSVVWTDFIYIKTLFQHVTLFPLEVLLPRRKHNLHMALMYCYCHIIQIQRLNFNKPNSFYSDSKDIELFNQNAIKVSKCLFLISVHILSLLVTVCHPRITLGVVLY